MMIVQLLFVVLAAVTWLIGGNVLVAHHYRRLGEPWWHGFRPFDFPFTNFNRREWAIVALLAFVSLSFMALATFLPNVAHALAVSN